MRRLQSLMVMTDHSPFKGTVYPGVTSVLWSSRNLQLWSSQSVTELCSAAATVRRPFPLGLRVDLVRKHNVATSNTVASEIRQSNAS